MSRIDTAFQPAASERAHGAGAGQAAAGIGRALKPEPVRRLAPKGRALSRRPAGQVWAAGLSTDIGDEHVCELNRRSSEDVITGLSRVLVHMENGSPGGLDAVDALFVTVLRESLRRYLLVARPPAAVQLPGSRS